MSLKQTILANLFINNGDYETPEWEQCAKIGDITDDGGEWEDVETTDRGVTDNNKTYAKTLKEQAYSFTMFYDAEFDHVIAIEEAYADPDAQVDLVMCDPGAGPSVEGSVGLRAPYIVTKFKKSKPIKGRQTVEVTIKKGDLRAAEEYEFPASGG